MHRVVALVAVALLLAGLVTPGVEAMTGCAQTCPDDDTSGRCADSACCSCCMSAGPATLISRVGADQAVLPFTAVPAVDGAPLAGEGTGLLHVPKAIRS